MLGIAAAAGAGIVLVRRQLRPLREVAATAHTVAELPLATGDIELAERVPDRLTDENTEVGQVGSALNTLLAHVESSLTARHESEQQVRQFVADASHELRTPLTTIAGYTELARRRPDDPATTRTALDKVEEESARMTSMVEDLLLLARLDSGRPLERHPVDLSRLLVEAVSDARVVDPGPPVAARPAGGVDRGQRRRTAAAPGRDQPAHQRPEVHAGRHHDHRLRPTPGGFAVHDDGPGFPPGLAEHAFERFARGDAARTRGDAGGAGLGLALVQAIVTAHGGSGRPPVPPRLHRGDRLPPLLTLCTAGVVRDETAVIRPEIASISSRTTPPLSHRWRGPGGSQRGHRRARGTLQDRGARVAA